MPLAPHVNARTEFRPAKIAALTHETTSVLECELEAADGEPLSVPLPGQFVEVRFNPAPDAHPVVRCYSLCGPPSTNRYRLGIKSQPNGIASQYLVERARVGDTVEVSAPQGSFVLRPGEGPLALVGAGIGVTPLLAMLYALVSERTQRDVWWLYGARNRAEHPFATDVRTLLTALPKHHEHTCYSRPGTDDVMGRDFDSVGHIDAELIEHCRVPREADFYLCGPAGFLEALPSGLRAWGVAGDWIHSEVFVPGSVQIRDSVDASSRKGPSEAGSGPLVSFARSDRVVRWNEASHTLLELAEACDVPVQWSCRMGVCHTCETGLLSGHVRYASEPIETPALGNVLLCCSQPADDVVLDL